MLHNIDWYVVLCLRGRLKLEVAGMSASHGKSTLKRVNQLCGTEFRTKKQALEHLEGVIARAKQEMAE